MIPKEGINIFCVRCQKVALQKRKILSVYEFRCPVCKKKNVIENFFVIDSDCTLDEYLYEV